MRRGVVTWVSVVVVAVAMAGTAGAAVAGLVGDDGQVAWAAAPAAGSVCTGDPGSGPFPDVAGDHRFCEDIEWFVVSGITTGYPDGTFRPASPVTRQAMAAFLWRWAGEPANGLVEPFFADVAADHPYFDAIQWMAEAGLATGTPGVVGAKPTFGPGAVVSRQALAAVLWRRFEEPAATVVEPAFADVGVGHPFYDAVQWMAESGLSTGTPAPLGLPLYRPADPVSRQAMAAFLHRADDLAPDPCPGGPVERLSVDRHGGEANGRSSDPAPSADGSRVAFVSEATDLVPGDTNGVADVFVKDCTTGEVWRASVASNGSQADAASSSPDLSADGRWVVFTSQATNLVAGAPASEVYRHDLETGDTVRASAATSPAWAYDAAISADGRHVISTRAAYQDGPNTVVQDVQVRDLETGQSWSVPPALESAYGCVLTSSHPSLSDDGRYGALWSETVWVLPECVPSGRQIVWFDRVAGTAEVISLDQEGTLGGGDEPQVSASGTTVVFSSLASDLVDDDTNGVADVFAWDAASGEVERVSVSSDGAQRSAASGSPSVSADGRYVSFASDGQVLVRDRAAGQTFVVPGPGAGTPDASLTAPVLTDDALQLVAASAGTTLVAGDVNGASDVFRLRTDHELLPLEHVVEPLPLAFVGEPYLHDLDAIGGVPPYTWSADGLPVDWAIDPDTGELSAVDPQVGSVEATVTVTDNVGTAVTRAITVVVADPPPCGPGPVAVSTDPDGAPSGGSAPDLTADGRYVAFTSEAPLLPTDTDAVADVYVRDCDTGRLDLVSVAPGGAPLTASSGHASISDDGRFVAFGSGWNAFVRDRLAATTTELTRCDPQSGTEWDAQGPAISADGSTVVVWRGNSTVPSGSSPYWTPVAYELGGGCEHLTVAGTSFADLAGLPLAVSGDGGTVAFVSFAALVDDDTNDTFDVYVLERATDAVTRVSVATGGGQSTGLVFYDDLSMSRDGRFVTFSAELLSPAFSDLAPDATDERDTFVHDRVAGTTALVSIGPDGQQVTPSPTGASISDEGRYVAFAGGTAGPHVLVRDLVLGETVQADLATGGGSSDSYGANPVLSADGRTVVFWSNATNLVDPPDTNGLPDVYRVVLPDPPPVP